MSHNRIAAISFVCAAFLAAAAPLRAQETKVPDTSKARVHLGPVALNPTIELTNFGVDTNVFNEPPGFEKSDFTFTLTPKTDAILKIGRVWATGNLREDVVWYQTYSTERAGNNYATGTLLVPLNRLAVAVSGGYVSARERPGYEIDVRAHRKELDVKTRIEYRALSKTFFAVNASRQRVDFDNDALFQSVNLQTLLNRTATAAAVEVKHQLTPLTSISVDVGRQQDRFEFSPARDSDSTVAGVRVTFDPFALIKGSARFGIRDFEPLDSTIPRDKVGTVSLDLSYVLQGSTRIGVQVLRDVQYSYDVNQPYYLRTGINGSFAQQIYGPVDVVVRGGVQNLNYHTRIGAIAVPPDRDDRVKTYGFGFGYHAGRDLRIGVNVDHTRRTSEVGYRLYEGLRFGTAVTYGL